ncbi:glycoside hydrolase family 10 protein [Cyanobacterium sp. Dongsha4]|uniref:glycoside hydrolase family 10 protein n=1 Tax=Cyanobacterium sp. DS4 TaxID=2878255 RepID=UPI002E81F3B6|nr:family 10 glycosylhydrolase [Cyanobacterium sp. Dongsha4]WVL00745.1 family 10 glycosylhydrolase [Cyanobacterium sp. Dongsha4]
MLFNRKSLWTQIQQTLLMLGLINIPPTFIEVVRAQNKPLSISQRPSVTVSQVSPREIEQMVNELQDLIYRVESTLITAEAQNTKYDGSMSAVVQELAKYRQLTNVSYTETKSNSRYSNNRAYEAIASAQQLLVEFPTLARQNFPQARRMWLDARRELWDNYPVDRPFAQSEIRAIWLDRGTIVKARSKADLEPLFNQMAEAGINTVFFETINASYPIYPSRVAPEQNPMTKGWDPLKAAIELAHERNMELHAWAWIFAAANQGHNQILGQPQNYLGPVLSRNPTWVLKDENGAVFNHTPGFKKAFFDPANPYVRNYLYSLLEEIATNYDVDGIQLDYIRYPFQDNHTKQTFGYTAASRHFFKESHGVDPKKIQKSSSAWSVWTGFKIKQIDSFVAEVSQRLKEKRPDLILSAAVFPMERNQRLNVLQQHWEEWIYSGWVDVMVLMTYALDTGSFEARTQSVHDLAGKNSGLVIPGIRLLSVPDTETFDQVQSIRNMPSTGYALFAAENFQPTLQKMLQQTQGTTASPIPYRKPFQSAEERYQALQKEWIFLLANNQINIDPAYLQQWSEQADKLGDRFSDLAQNPTPAKLKDLEKDLSIFKVRFSHYLAKHNQENPEQVETWKNRLATLESLLKYGERTVFLTQN